MTDENDQSPKKMFVLHVALPDFNGDELDEYAGYMSEPDPPGDDDRLEVAIGEWMRRDVHVILTSIPGEKCMNDDFEVYSMRGRIVGAETRARGGVS